MPTNAAATGFWSAQNSNNARQGRALIQALFGNNDGTPMNGTRSGVMFTTGYTVMSDLLVQVVSGLTLTVAPGTGLAHRTGQGPYMGWVLGSTQVTCDPAPASNPRNDIVLMRMYDSAQGDVSPDGNPCRLEIITGTPAPSPSDPITPNAIGVYTSFPTTGGGVGIPLARAQVSTGGVVTLTDLRRSAYLTGSVRLITSSDISTPVPARVGDLRYLISSNRLDVFQSDATWHGIRPLIVTSSAIPTVPSTLTFPYTVLTMSIPDPGWPYYLTFDGIMPAAFGSGGTFDIVPRDGANNGPNLIPPTRIPADSQRNGNATLPWAMTGTSAQLSGSRTVYITIDWLSGAGNGFALDGSPGNTISATITPA